MCQKNGPKTEQRKTKNASSLPTEARIKARMMKTTTFLLAITYITTGVAGYSTRGPPAPVRKVLEASSRRSVLGSVLATIAGSAAVGVGQPAVAHAEDAAAASAGLTDVYFGVGCFWHIQHEFVQAERDLLGRGDRELTSRTGYAGGTKADKEGRVCYHNFSGIADYGKLGHGEVVGMKIPEDKIGDFAVVYFSLYSPTTGERVDPGDRGSEYRSLIGLPGGKSHPEYAKVEEAALASGKTLALGKGNDPDTLGKKLVYVYDSNKFPFYQGEVYHQFHDDFQSPAYGKAYNNLANLALEDGRIKGVGCPDRV